MYQRFYTRISPKTARLDPPPQLTETNLTYPPLACVCVDLSFNNITVIEGLDTLTKLTDLTLFNNRITKLENMDNLTNLQVFSIGNNNIPTLESVSLLLRCCRCTYIYVC